MFRASSAHFQEDTDEHLMLETCRGEKYFMNK